MKPATLLPATLLILLAGCGNGEASAEALATTCQDWVDMDLPLEEALADEDGLSDQQENIAKELLDAHRKTTDTNNLINFKATVISACAPDDTGTRPSGTIDELIRWE